MKRFLVAAILSATPLFSNVNVVAISGSTRDDSLNKKLLNEAVDIAKKQGATVTVVDLRELPIPFYDGDLEKDQGLPVNAKKLRQILSESQAIIIATPEYNGSISSVLKNALDWSSRNEQGGPSRDAFNGKKVALLSASPGQTGGSRAIVHLTAIVQDIGGKVLPNPVTLPNATQAFDEKGHLKDPSVRKRLEQEIKSLLS